MSSLNESVKEYKSQLAKGHIKLAYRGIIEYMMNLKTNFKKKHSEYYVSSLYQGYMDMSYFAIVPDLLKAKKLKVAIVFIHEEIKFEIWLSGANKDVQLKYWNIFKEKDLKNYHVPPSIKGSDSIIEYTLVKNPNFNDPGELTKQIEFGTTNFLKEILPHLRITDKPEN